MYHFCQDNRNGETDRSEENSHNRIRDVYVGSFIDFSRENGECFLPHGIFFTEKVREKEKKQACRKFGEKWRVLLLLGNRRQIDYTKSRNCQVRVLIYNN